MRRISITALVLLAGLLGGAIQPTSLPAEETGPCGDGLWEAYNECLVSTSNYFIRAMCDLEFMLTWYNCRKPKA